MLCTCLLSLVTAHITVRFVPSPVFSRAVFNLKLIHITWHDLLFVSLDTMSTIKPTKTITYKTVDKLEIPLDLYLPDNADKVPVLLWFHGGGLL